MSLRQQVTPDHLLAGSPRRSGPFISSLGPVGAAVLTWTAGRYGVGRACVAAGAGCLLIAAAALFTPIRQPTPELASDTA